MTPDEINAQYGKAVYHCRVCRVSTGLHWFMGTSCPVCSKPECSVQLSREIAESIAAEEAFQAEYEARYGR